ncbi:hypothetical protein [Myroides odoratus]|uniref:hypothetical protein n=1 Tax=Myroides odoratus TaxID=256 RepID=UPI0039AEF8E4
MDEVWNVKGVDLENALDELYDIIFFVKQITPKLKTVPNEAFFWSGKTDGIGGELVALDISKSKKGITLEGLIKRNNIAIPMWDLTNAKTIKIWELVSKEYAREVSGEIRAVVGRQLRKNNIWESFEFPALKEKLNVTKISIIDPKTKIERIIFIR